MVFFMVFIARSKAVDLNTMRGELMQSWYFVGADQMPVFYQGWRYFGL